MLARIAERQETRRRAILDAAKRCFLRHGYRKTSLLDIALEARLSRPLLYLVFTSKLEILGAVFEAAYASRYDAVAESLRGTGSRREKLVGLYERLVLDPWRDGDEFESSRELSRTFAEELPQVAAIHERRRARYTRAILGSKELADVFVLAVDGLRRDAPSIATFRKRLHLLADRFAE